MDPNKPIEWKFWPTLVGFEVFCFSVTAIAGEFTGSWGRPGWMMGMICITFIAWACSHIDPKDIG